MNPRAIPTFGRSRSSESIPQIVVATGRLNDEDAIAPVADLAKQLGFAPVKLGKLNEGGALVHARGRTWGQLIFQDLLKKEQ